MFSLKGSCGLKSGGKLHEAVEEYWEGLDFNAPASAQVVLVADRDPGSLPDKAGVEATKEFRYTVVKREYPPLPAGIEPEDLHFSLHRRPKRVVLNLPENSSGGTLYVAARWLNTIGRSGPWCDISKTVIT